MLYIMMFTANIELALGLQYPLAIVLVPHRLWLEPCQMHLLFGARTQSNKERDMQYVMLISKISLLKAAVFSVHVFYSSASSCSS
jgi:hypothetical protein